MQVAPSVYRGGVTNVGGRILRCYAQPIDSIMASRDSLRRLITGGAKAW